jgi:iron complex outermembrane receptor protein
MRFTTILAAGVGLAALSIGGDAFAQTASTQDPAASDLGDIIVTARKREERLADVPVAVTAITAETIEQRQLTSVRDIAQVTPGLNISSDSVGRANISIRGVGVTLLDNVQPGVGIFVDGVYQVSTSYLNSPTLAVEQIEVLRGPQSTLFGQNTLGGAINVTTKQPTDEFEGRITATYADPDNYYIVGGTISGPIVPGVLRGRLTVGTQSRDGFISNSLLGYDDANALKQDTIRGALTWDGPGEAFVTLNAYADSVEGASALYSLTTGPTVYTDDAQTNFRNDADYDYWGVNAKLETPISASTNLTAIVSHDRRDNKNSSDGDFQPLPLFYSEAAGELRTTSGEVRLDTRWSDNLSTLVGVFASNQASDLTNVNTLLITAPPTVIPGAAYSDADIWAVFGTAFLDIRPDLELTVGLRYDKQTIDFSSLAATSQYDAEEIQPRIALRKKFGEDAMVYGSIARGFRGGGTNGPGAPNPVYDGDSVWTYEVGTKLATQDRRLSFAGAAFYNDYSDIIAQNSLAPSTSGVGIVGINLNTGDAESYGVEGEFRAQLTDAWSVSGGGILMHSEITDGSRFVQTTGRQLPTDRIAFQPDWTVNLQTDYFVAVGPGELQLSAGVVGKGDRMGASLSETFAPELEEYFLANASITYRVDQIEVALFANNLFDEEYYESFIDSSTLTVAGLPALGSLGQIGDRRRVGVRLGYSF